MGICVGCLFFQCVDGLALADQHWLARAVFAVAEPTYGHCGARDERLFVGLGFERRPRIRQFGRLVDLFRAVALRLYDPLSHLDLDGLYGGTVVVVVVGPPNQLRPSTAATATTTESRVVGVEHSAVLIGGLYYIDFGCGHYRY